MLMHIDEEQRRSRPRLGRGASWEISCMSNPHGWSWARTTQLSVKVPGSGRMDTASTGTGASISMEKG
ncbi:uncharacterized [Tachysurus ichikawai]